MDQAPPASELQSPSALALNTVVSSGSGTGNVPTGAMAMYIATTPPSGWLVCDGTAISRTTYSALFALISTNYGVGDGATTFNLPDVQGRMPVGKGTNAAVSALGATDGVTTVANRRPQHRTTDAKTVNAGTLAVNPSSHSHTIGAMSPGVDSNGIVSSSWDGIARQASPSVDATSLGISGAPALGGSVGTNNANDALDAPCFLTVVFIIKY